MEPATLAAMIAQPSTTSSPVDASPKPYRVIYSLHYDLAPLPDDPPGSVTALVVPLDRTGNCSNPKAMVQPRDRSKRIIDLRIGDELLVAGKWRMITSVSAYRENWLTAERAAVCEEGYVYRPAAKCVGGGYAGGGLARSGRVGYGG